MAKRITHVGFSDESNWNTGRFRSLGLVTLPLRALDDISQRLYHLLAASGVKEFKWNNLDGDRERVAAEKMCDLAIDEALKERLRVDVLTWDIQDSRHNIKGRDDIANLQRMYYHLFRNVLRARWTENAIWRLHPDENTAMNWQTLEDCLQSVAESWELEHSLFTGGKFRLRLRREFALEEIIPVTSQEQPLLQLADLFAGMAVFSRCQFDAYQEWLKTQSGQPPLIETDEETTAQSSKRSILRFQVLQHFDEACKKHKLGVSLKRKRGLWTPDPQKPINFWMYEPQQPEDKAPIRR